MSRLIYHALHEYLIGRKPTKHDVFLPWLLIIVSFAGVFFTRAPFRLLWLVLFAAAFIAMLVAHGRNKQKMPTEDKQTKAWMDTLIRFSEAGGLEERSHPDLVQELEDCARLRQAALNGLQAPTWSQMVSNEDWKRIEQLCRKAADDLMVEALWAAKPLIRQYGARRSTFERLCGDPAYTERPLAAVRLARSNLERLVYDISDFPLDSMRVDALSQAQRELDSIRQAVQELEQHS